MITEQITSEDLSQGRIIRQPLGREKGYWAGAPGVYHDKTTGDFYLTYRIRRPRGVLPDRGAETRIARSSDGVCFEDVWSVSKEALSTSSIERTALRRDADGHWRLFVSYVDPADSRWCVCVIQSPTVEKLNVNRSRMVFTASDLNLEGVKVPWIFKWKSLYYVTPQFFMAVRPERA